MAYYNIFISTNKRVPDQWRRAFPDARILAEIPRDCPAGALLWLHNPNAQTLAALPRLTSARTIVLHDEPSEAKGLEALAAKAAGYANAHATPEVLHAIESVVRQGGLWVGELLLGRLLRNIAHIPAPTLSPGSASALSKLTAREQTVAQCIARGESNKEIARTLDITERTVKAHLGAIFEKLGARDRLHLALLIRTSA